MKIRIFKRDKKRTLATKSLFQNPLHVDLMRRCIRLADPNAIDDLHDSLAALVEQHRITSCILQLGRSPELCTIAELKGGEPSAEELADVGASPALARVLASIQSAVLPAAPYARVQTDCVWFRVRGSSRGTESHHDLPHFAESFAQERGFPRGTCCFCGGPGPGVDWGTCQRCGSAGLLTAWVPLQRNFSPGNHSHLIFQPATRPSVPKFGSLLLFDGLQTHLARPSAKGTFRLSIDVRLRSPRLPAYPLVDTSVLTTALAPFATSPRLRSAESDNTHFLLSYLAVGKHTVDLSILDPPSSDLWLRRLGRPVHPRDRIEWPNLPEPPENGNSPKLDHWCAEMVEAWMNGPHPDLVVARAAVRVERLMHEFFAPGKRSRGPLTNSQTRLVLTMTHLVFIVTDWGLYPQQWAQFVQSEDTRTCLEGQLLQALERLERGVETGEPVHCDGEVWMEVAICVRRLGLGKPRCRAETKEDWEEVAVREAQRQRSRRYKEDVVLHFGYLWLLYHGALKINPTSIAPQVDGKGQKRPNHDRHGCSPADKL